MRLRALRLLSVVTTLASVPNFILLRLYRFGSGDVFCRWRCAQAFCSSQSRTQRWFDEWSTFHALLSGRTLQICNIQLMVSCVVTGGTTFFEFLTLLPRFVGPFDFEPSDFEPFDFPLLLLLLLLPFQLLFSCDFADLEVIEPPFSTVGDRLFMLLFFFAEGHCRFVNPVDGELFRRDRATATTSCEFLTLLPRFIEPFDFEPSDFPLLLLLLLPLQSLFSGSDVFQLLSPLVAAIRRRICGSPPFLTAEPCISEKSACFDNSACKTGLSCQLELFRAFSLATLS